MKGKKMATESACTGCGTELASAGHLGVYCPNPDCDLEQRLAAQAFRAMTERREREMLERLKAKYEIEAETITISLKEYNSLKDDSFKLSCLEAGGVDNWEWYHESLQENGYYTEEEDEDE
jgi:hypothetical protein